MILIAEYVLIKCDQEHNKHVVEKFSYVSRTPMRSCAICLDMTQGLFDWEIELLKDIPKTNNDHLDRLMLAANVHNVTRTLARV